MGKLVTTLMSLLVAMAVITVPVSAQGCIGEADGTPCDNGNPCMDSVCLIEICFSTTAVPNSPRVPCDPDGAPPYVGYCVDGSCNFNLPVELTNFSALLSGDVIRVSWETASEENNAGFGIQMRRPGEEFVEVGYLDGAGNSLVAHRYSIDVNRMGSGVHFIRLRIEDFDGNSEYTNNIEIRSELPNRFVLNAAYPNPFNPTTTMGFMVVNDADVALRVYDSCGREVETLFQGRAAGMMLHEFQFDARDLPSGAYFYRLETPAGAQVRSLTLVK
jgi:hypothetical protein